MRTVAALYVDPRGPYPKMQEVDCWDEARDARLYAGPHSVVAHPPCGPWSRLSHFSKHQDKTCAPRALEQVRAYGGVLEHPVDSRLWKEFSLPKSGDWADSFGGLTVELDQVHWGHKCRKRTWLYVVGVGVPDIWALVAASADMSAQPTHAVDGGPREKGRLPGVSHEARRRTPPRFAELLSAIARTAHV